MILSRQSFLYALLLITLGLVWFAPGEDVEPVVVKARRSEAGVSRESSDKVSTAYVLVPRQLPAERFVNIFASVAQPQASMTNRRPGKTDPVLPPPPYSFIGTMAEEGQEKIFLQHGEQMLVVKVGEIIHGRYQVLGIGQGRVDVLFLPANIRQTILENKSGAVVPRAKAEEEE